MRHYPVDRPGWHNVHLGQHDGWQRHRFAEWEQHISLRGPTWAEFHRDTPRLTFWPADFNQGHFPLQFRPLLRLGKSEDRGDYLIAACCSLTNREHRQKRSSAGLPRPAYYLNPSGHRQTSSRLSVTGKEPDPMREIPVCTDSWNGKHGEVFIWHNPDSTTEVTISEVAS